MRLITENWQKRLSVMSEGNKLTKEKHKRNDSWGGLSPKHRDKKVRVHEEDYGSYQSPASFSRVDSCWQVASRTTFPNPIIGLDGVMRLVPSNGEGAEMMWVSSGQSGWEASVPLYSHFAFCWLDREDLGELEDNASWDERTLGPWITTGWKNQPLMWKSGIGLLLEQDINFVFSHWNVQGYLLQQCIS